MQLQDGALGIEQSSSVKGNPLRNSLPATPTTWPYGFQALQLFPNAFKRLAAFLSAAAATSHRESTFCIQHLNYRQLTMVAFRGLLLLHYFLKALPGSSYVASSCPPTPANVCLSVSGAGRQAVGRCSSLTLEGSNLRAGGVRE